MIALHSYASGDADAVVRLWWDSWHSIRPDLKHPQTLMDWRERWIHDIVPTQTIAVARDHSDVVIGFAAADLRTRELTQLFVAPDRKGSGIGGRLLLWAKEQMPTGFTLRTLTVNQVSRTFYARAGLIEGGTAISSFNRMQTIEYRWDHRVL